MTKDNELHPLQKDDFGLFALILLIHVLFWHLACFLHISSSDLRKAVVQGLTGLLHVHAKTPGVAVLALHPHLASPEQSDSSVTALYIQIEAWL